MHSGRIDRIGFLLGIGYLVFPVVEAILAYMVLSAVVGHSSLGRQSLDTLVFTVGCPFFVLWLVVFVVGMTGLLMRRWHDLGLSGWMSVLLLLPLVGIVVVVLLLVTRGTSVPNKHGSPASPRRPFPILFGG